MTGFQQLVKLVKRFTSSPSSLYAPKDIAITFGEARISYYPKPSDLTHAGQIDRSVYAKLMLDAATLAAGSLVEDREVANDSFSMYGPVDVQSTVLTAVARMTHNDQGRYTVETRLLDENRNPIGSGYGTFSINPVEESNETETESVEAQDSLENAPRPLRIAYGALWKSPIGLLNLN